MRGAFFHSPNSYGQNRVNDKKIKNKQSFYEPSERAATIYELFERTLLKIL
jgi:hypothetical protein